MHHAFGESMENCEDFNRKSKEDLWIREMIITIWLFNIAMENGHFIDGLPIKNVDFPWLC